MSTAIEHSVTFPPASLAGLAHDARDAKAAHEAVRRRLCAELLMSVWDRAPMVDGYGRRTSYRSPKTTPGGADVAATDALLALAAAALAELACKKHASLIATLRAGCVRAPDRVSAEAVELS